MPSQVQEKIRPAYADDWNNQNMEVNKALSRDDVSNQARLLLNKFIKERMEQDMIQDSPSLSDLIEPGTPVGPPMDHAREVGRALRCIGDELDKDERMLNLIARVPPEAEHKTFLNVASEIFKDGVVNWGRIVALFYFAYKICLKALDRIPLIRAMINLVVDFIRDHVAGWIIGRGGWEAIVEYFGTPTKQVAVILGAGVLVSGIVMLWKGWH
ncbi:apoptosis regulator BAX [Patella vulgata]|uniref:apoptosis regulator BAX n=1 Tax=Patella vulgata TaxID=6465 RepID=UPI00217F8D60|nr:apoptosis regulator BAX [Patella vulgata]